MIFGMHWFDFSIVTAYFGIILYIGVFQGGKRTKTLGDFFVTVKCRRMYRWGKASELHRLRQRKYRARRKGDAWRDGTPIIPYPKDSHKRVTQPDDFPVTDLGHQDDLIEVNGKRITLREWQQMKGEE